MKTLRILIVLLLAPAWAFAQSSSGGNGGVTVSGAVTVGHCTAFAGPNTIQDAGSACGGTGSSPGGSPSAVQFNSSGVFGGTATTDLSYTAASHTTAVGSTGILDLHLAATSGLLLPGGLSTGLVTVTTSTGAISSVAAPAGAVVGTTDSQTLTNKSIAGSEINSGTVGSTYGGLGANASAFTGVLRFATGTASASELSSDATTSGSNAVTVKGINGTLLSGLSTGLLRNTTTTGVPSSAELSGDATTSGSNAVTVLGINGGVVPTSAAFLSTNGSARMVAAPCTAAQILVGNVSNLAVCQGLSGDSSITNAGVMTNTGINGLAFPTSASVVGSNGSAQPVAATAHGIQTPQACAGAGSGTAQTCSTSVTFVAATPDCVNFNPGTTNTGDVTLAVNGGSAFHVYKWAGSSTLSAGDMVAGVTQHMCLDASNRWELPTVGNAPASGATINNALQYSVPFYSVSGSNNTLSGANSAAPPATQGYFNLDWVNTTSAATQPQAVQVGFGSRAITGSGTLSDTVLWSDVDTCINQDFGSSGTLTEHLPTPTLLNNTGFAFCFANDSAQTATIDPHTTYGFTIRKGNAAATNTITVASGEKCGNIRPDPTTPTTQWLADCGPNSGGGTTLPSGNQGQPLINTTGGAIYATDPVYLDSNQFSGADTCAKINAANLTTLNSTTGIDTWDPNVAESNACASNPMNNATGRIWLGPGVYQAAIPWFFNNIGIDLWGTVRGPSSGASGTTLLAKSGFTAAGGGACSGATGTACAVVQLGTFETACNGSAGTCGTFNNLIEHMNIDANAQNGVSGYQDFGAQETSGIQWSKSQNSTIANYNVMGGNTLGENGSNVSNFESIYTVSPQTCSTPTPTNISAISNGAPNSLGTAVATVTLSGTPSPPLAPYEHVVIAGQSNGGTHGTVYNGDWAVCYAAQDARCANPTATSFTILISATASDSGTANGNVALYPWSVLAETNISGFRGFHYGTINGQNLGCEVPILAEMSGFSLVMDNTHIENNGGSCSPSSACGIGLSIGDTFPSSNWWVQNDNISNFVKTAVQISGNFPNQGPGAILNLKGGLGSANPSVNNIIDVGQSNTITVANNPNVGFYFTDGNGYPFTNVNPVDLTNGLNTYNGTLAFYNGGVSKFSVTSVGHILATEPTGSIWGSATGGAKGAGTINATGLYINGTSVGTGGTVTVVGAGNLTSTAFVTGGGTQTLQTPSATATLTSGGAPTFPGDATFSAAAAHSTSSVLISSPPDTGGSGTTTQPVLYLQSTGSAPTGFSTAGTGLAFNAPSGFTGNIFDSYVNGGTNNAFTVSYGGGATNFENLNARSGFTGNFLNYQINGGSPVFQVNYQGNTVITQTAGTQFALNIQNVTAATSSTAQNSPFDIRSGTAWYNQQAATGSPAVAAVSVADCWSHQVLETNGSNGASIYNIAHNNAVDNCVGSPATAEVQVPYSLSNGVTTTNVAAPAAPTVVEQGTAASSQWSYAITACTGPSCTNASPATQITNGQSTLCTPPSCSSGFWNKVTWVAVTGADYYRVRRTQSGGTPATLGTICVIPAGTTLECDDKGLTGDASATETVNVTGNVYVGNGPNVGCAGTGCGGGTFATAGTIPGGLVSTDSGWYTNPSNQFDIVNGTTDEGAAAALAQTQTFTHANTFTGGIINTTTPIRDQTRFVLVAAMTAATGTITLGSTGAGNSVFSWPVTAANWYDMECKLPVTMVSTGTIRFELYAVSGGVTISNVNAEAMGNTNAAAAFQDLSTLGGTSLATSETPVSGASGGSSEMITYSAQFLTSHAGNIGLEAITATANGTMLLGGQCGLTQIN